MPSWLSKLRVALCNGSPPRSTAGSHTPVQQAEKGINVQKPVSSRSLTSTNMGQPDSSAYDNALKALSEIQTANFSDAERTELILRLRGTLSKVETPWQQAQALIWENSCHAAALKTAHDIGLFQNWLQNGSEVLSLEQLSKVVRQPCDPALLDRVLRALAYKATLNSPELNMYSLTPFAKALGDPIMGSCLDYWFDFQLPALSHLPSYLKSTSHKLPSDPMNTAWNLATGDPTPFFGWLQQRPEKMAIFGQTMGCYSGSQAPWVELYPADKLLQGYDSSSPLVVDIGGSHGHDLLKFVGKFNPPKGSCYLQDKEEVVAQAPPNDAIVTKSIDFFKEQPVKDARAYYLHSVLHDWTDDQCREILANVKASMKAGISKVLIHELIRIDDSSRDLTSLGEFTVMAILGAPERSEKQWRDLIDSTGMKVTQIYSNPLSAHSILEVEM